MADGFSTEGGFNRLDVQIQQRPLVGWAVAAHLSIFPVMCLGMGSNGPLWELATTWFFACAGMFVFGLRWKRPVELEISPFELDVKAFAGRFARPVRRTLPLTSLEWRWKEGGGINNQPVHILILQSGDAPPLELRGMVCAPGHQEVLNDALTAARDRARQLEGDGAAEVPAALANLRAQAAAPPKA